MEKLDLDTELKLLAGLSIVVDDIEIKPLTLREIIKIGYNNYINNLNIYALKVSDLFQEITDDIKDIKVFDIILNVNDIYQMFQYSSVIFFNYNTLKADLESQNIIFDEDKFLHRNNWDKICKIIKLQNCMVEKNEEEEFNFANERARKFMEEIKKIKQNAPKKKEEVNLSSIISSVAYKSNIGINNILDLTIYQLYDAYYRLNIIDNYDKTMVGIYAGTVDSKKINLKDINWAKIITN